MAIYRWGYVDTGVEFMDNHRGWGGMHIELISGGLLLRQVL
jgi:hypothetical protein